MAEKRSSGGGGEVVIDVHSEETPKLLNEIEARDPPVSPNISKCGLTLKKKLKGVMIEWLMFLLLSGSLIASLTLDELHNIRFWDLKIWKWCLLALVMFSGMLVARLFVCLVVFLLEINCLLGKKVMYFVHGLKKNVQVLVWLGSVLTTWLLLFLDVERSKTASKILEFVTWALVSLVIAAFLWLLKNLLLMMFYSSFHRNNFFDRIQESLFHQYIIKTLSGVPLIELAEETMAHSTVRNAEKGKGNETKEIDIGKPHKLKREKVSSWQMKLSVDAITNSVLSTISNSLDGSSSSEDGEEEAITITSEAEAKAAAYQIFRNVAHPHNRYIDEDDLLRFMIKEEVDLVLQLFEGTSNDGKINRKSFLNWTIKAFRERRALALTLSDTKSALEQLNKLVKAILIVVTFIIWLLLVGTATTRVLLVIAAFLFGETCKTIFQVVVFVFVMHPFDVGDRCVVDGVQLTVEEINILTTIFLKKNNEKVYYPNSVLFSKPISNYCRSPDMGESVEFCIDFRTPAETIGRLRAEITRHLEDNRKWHPGHQVVVTEIENDSKLKMALHCIHTMNFQDFGERNKRRTDLIFELKRILEELGIRYDLLPEQGTPDQVTRDRPDATNAMLEE